jgi:hypothetical protein
LELAPAFRIASFLHGAELHAKKAVRPRFSQHSSYSLSARSPGFSNQMQLFDF